jgi:outer membrane protein OmpA-like peptidoglycan-associated protein/tetratricopeptide (TPR) repeat protein
LANSYYYINAYSLAETWYARVIQQDDASQEAHLNYAEVLKQQGKYMEAKEQYRAYASKYGESQTITNAILGADSAAVWIESPTKHLVRNEANVNTALAEFALTPTSGGAIFVAEPHTIMGEKSGMTGEAYLRVYSASRYDDASLNYPNMMEATFNNTLYHVGPVAVDSTEETLYVTRTYAGKAGERVKVSGRSWRAQNLELKIYHKDGESWIEEDFPYNNVKEYSVGHAALNSEDNILYFASDMPGGVGGVDIWYCERQSDGSWGSPQNAGAAINTFGDEMFPSVFGETLYFSSTGHVGMGGLDIFRAKGSKNQFSTPVNMAYPINSASDDFAFVVMQDDYERAIGYLSSNRTGGVGSDDIYAFNYTKPKITIQLEALAKDKTSGEPIGDVEVSIFNGKDELLSKGNTAADGTITFDIPRDEALRVLGDKKGYMADNMFVGAVTPQADTLLHVTLLMQSVQQVGERFVLEDIYYDFDKHDIRPDAALILDKLVKTLLDNPSLKIELSSHTDSRGSNKYNMALSQRRAQSAVDYIVSRGVDSSRLKAQGYGETRLVNECADGVTCTEEQHQANRRTEIEILEY